MEYHALFTDFDGTLRTNASGVKISEANIKAIHTAKAAGKHVVICSGRSWKSLAPYEEMLGLNKPGGHGVAFNGGVVYAYTEKGREILFRQTMETATAHNIIRQLRQLASPEVKIFAYDGNDDLYAEEHLRGKVRFGEDSYLELAFVDDFLEMTNGFSKFVLLGDNSELKKIANQVSGDYDTVFSAHDLFEFVPPGVNKGQGVAFLADYLKIPMEKIIAMGDEGNDAAMLKRAGLGVAVANATAPAKEVADIVLAESCDEDAVSVVINRYLL